MYCKSQYTRRAWTVVGIFFRWHEKRESAQLRKILFLLLDRNCDFRNHRCYHRRCRSSQCCLLLIFAPEKVKKLRALMHFAECPQFFDSYFSEAIRLPLHNYDLNSYKNFFNNGISFKRFVIKIPHKTHTSIHSQQAKYSGMR